MSHLSTRFTNGVWFWLAFVVTMSPAAAGTPGQMSRAEAALVQADSDRFRAMVDRDIPALARALADELTYVHSSSTKQTKKEHLGDLEAGKAVYERIDVKEQLPAVYGKTGVIQGVATFKTAGRVPSTFTLRYTDVYVMRDGRWQMVSWHCTKMQESE